MKRRVVVGSLLGSIGCSGSEADEPVTTFTPPASGATIDGGSTEMGTGMNADDPANPALSATPSTGNTSEEPGAGITGGVMSAPATEGGASPVSMPAASVGSASGESTETPTEPGTPPAADPAATTASAGSGKAPAPGKFTLPINGADAAFTITVRPNYDPATPVPFIFGFHGRNQTHIQFRTQDGANIQTELGSRAVMAHLESQAGPGWNFPERWSPTWPLQRRLRSDARRLGTALLGGAGDAGHEGARAVSRMTAHSPLTA